MAERAEECVRIPIHGRGGVVAYALVDAQDALSIGAHRWNLNKGYAKRDLWRNGERRTVRMHREILGLGIGDSRQADHVNRNRLDNRRSNLRMATAALNRQNVPNRGGASRFRGVGFFKRTGKWTAQSMLDGKRIWHGYFDSELEAARAAHAFRDEHMPYAQPDPELAKLEEVRDA